MTIIQQGQVNLAALQRPDIVVQITPPGNYLINGTPTNVLGIVGTATWGPVNSPAIASGPADAQQQFGGMKPRKYDLVTAVNAAALQGASNFRLVRVTDGTDTAASATITAASSALATALAAAINLGQSGQRTQSQLVVASSSGATLTLTAKYTGTTGNTLQAAIGPGSAANTSRLVISLPGLIPETFDNAGAASSTASTATFSGGTDGATTITSTVLVGLDTVPRKGMYALRGSGASVAMLADADDSTQWAAQVAYGLSEGTYMVMTGPAGDTIANAVSAKATAGIDSYAAKLLFGDWVYFSDALNGQVRLISPQGYAAGKLAALSPEQSGLNKPLNGVIGTQKSSASQQYSGAELDALTQAGFDLVCNPAVRGNAFALRTGRNTSSNAGTSGDSYTRMTNFVAATLNTGMGIFVGETITADERRRAKATLDSYLSVLRQLGMIEDFLVILDATNNSPSREALGYQQADIRVRYLGIVSYLICNLEGGASVQTRLLPVNAA